jgi:Domain of Unknown Function (DUF1259)
MYLPRRSLLPCLAVLVAAGDARSPVAGRSLPVPAQGIDWSAVAAAIGRPGALQAGEVYRVAFPRSDLQVMVGAVRIRTPFALGGWTAFHAAPGGAMLMGDLVLVDSEVAPVIARLQAGGIQQTAIHHHLLGESPRLTYVHVHAVGDPVHLAAGIRAAVALTATPPASASAPAAPSLDSAAIAGALGLPVRAAGDVYQASVPRSESIRDGGREIPPSMGIATAINFQPAPGGQVAITGDFVLRASEVNPVIAELGAHGIAVTSLHNHLLDDEPRLFFMHFWAIGDARELARGLRAALDRTGSRLPPR